MKIFLLGTSGLVGSAVYSELLQENPRPDLITFTRRRLGLEGGLEKVSDLSDFKIQMHELTAELAFCALGTTIKKAKSRQTFEEIELNLPLRFATEARKHGVQSFHIITALGADASSSNFYLRTKGLLERDLRLLGFPSLHIYRPSLLVGDRQEFRLGERLSVALYQNLKGLYPKALGRYQPIEVSVLSRFILRKMKDYTPGLHIWENQAMISS
ncbi:MAG: hypothetical protein V4655_00250 [Bdellovibrionota bacterium]